MTGKALWGIAAAVMVVIAVAAAIALASGFGTRPLGSPIAAAPTPSVTPTLATATPVPQPTTTLEESPTVIPLWTAAPGCGLESPPAPLSTTNPDGPSDRDAMLAKAQGLPTFAGIWVDPFRAELHVAVTSDPAEAVSELRPLLPRGQTLYVHQFEHSMAELTGIRDRMFSDRDRLLAEGIYLSSGGVDVMANCAQIGIDPVTPQVVDEIRTRYGDPIEFEFEQRPFVLASPWPTEPEVVQAVETAAPSVQLLTCGGHSFPASVLAEPAVDDVPSDLAGPLDAALKFWATDAPIPSGLHWRLAFRDDTSAEFVAMSGSGWMDVNLSKDAQGWKPAGFGDCQPAGAGIEGVGRASWVFDPAYDAPTAQSTELHVLITERACASGQPAFGRIAPAVVVYTAATLTLTVGVREFGGIATCPSNPPTPATIVLPLPLGDRTVAAGDAYSPGPSP